MTNRHRRKSSLILLLSKYALPFRNHIILLLLITLAAGIFAMLQPLILSGVIEVIIKRNTSNNQQIEVRQSKGILKYFDLNRVGRNIKETISSFVKEKPESFEWKLLIALLTLFILVAFIAVLLNYISRILTRWIQTAVMKLVRQDLVSHLFSLGMSYFNKQKSGELISRVTIDASATAEGIGPLVHGLIYNGILIAFYSIYLLATSFWLSFGTIGIILLHYIVTRFIKKPLRKTEKAHFDTIAKLATTLQESLTNIKVIKSFGADRYEKEKVQIDIDGCRNADFKLGVIKDIQPNAREFLNSFAVMIIILLAIIQLINKELSVNGFLLFVYVGRLLIIPINIFSVYIVNIQTIMASFDRIEEILSKEKTVLGGDKIISNFHKEFNIRSIRFAYEDRSEIVLNDISFDIKKGETVALAGVSGSGKSTLIDIILRLYDPQDGEISIDGNSLRDLNEIEYRKIFGVVPQESLLFNDSIENNIRFGRKEINYEMIEKAAKTSNAHKFIKALPNGYQTAVGERGTRLSGGQRQRIAIARAVASLPQVIIFDEATSSLDSESEKEVNAAIENISTKLTTIIVTHRLSTITQADKIVVFNKGKIEAIGRHQQLQNSSSTYKKFCELQFKQYN